VRGLVMVLMALDHTRDFICNIPFEPENIDQTWGFYFLVRWVTHLCAPAFFFLAGVGAYLYGRRHSPGELQSFWFRAASGWWCWSSPSLGLHGRFIPAGACSA
jgi:uncharacterized membrane protein